MHVIRTALLFLTLILSASTVLAASAVNCKLKAGSVIQLPADVCSKEGGQVIEPLAPTAATATADQYFAIWEVNKRTNHQTAAKAGKDLLAAYPDDPRATEVQAWVSAYEKVMASRPVASPSNSTASSAPSLNQGPDIEETKRFIIKVLDARDEILNTNEPERRQQTKVLSREFDSCVLRVNSTGRLSGLFSNSLYVGKFSFFFNVVDPSSVEIVNNRGFFGARFRAIAGEAVRQLDFFKNSGSFENPRMGEQIDAGTLSSSIVGNGDNKRAGSSIINSEVLMRTMTLDVAASLVNAIKDLVRQCGGKASPY